MKKVFLLCMAGALALAATACDDDKGGGNSAKITVNGRTEPVKSAFYELDGNDVYFYLFSEALTEFPDVVPEFAVGIVYEESILGKTLDLTRPLDNNSWLNIAAQSNGAIIDINYHDGLIEPGEGVSVTAGTLTLTQEGAYFSIKLSVTLSNGNSFSADWQGTAIKFQRP